jgi:hypothetical protein
MVGRWSGNIAATTYPAPLAQRQSNGLLIRRLSVQIRRGAPGTTGRTEQHLPSSTSLDTTGLLPRPSASPGMPTSVVQGCWLGDRRCRVAEHDPISTLVLAKNCRIGTTGQHVFGRTLLATRNNRFEVSGDRVESYVVDLSDLVPAIAQSSFANQLQRSTNSGLICVISWRPEGTVVSHEFESSGVVYEPVTRTP